MPQSPRLMAALEAFAGLIVLCLAMLRPLVWSGDLTSLADLFMLALASGGIACGIFLRVLDGGRITMPRVWLPAVAFLGIAVLGCLRSPLPARSWAEWSSWAVQLAAAVALAPVIARRPGLLIAGLLTGSAVECMYLVAEASWFHPALVHELNIDPIGATSPALLSQFEDRAHSWRLEGTFLLANTLGGYLIMIIPLLAALVMSARPGWRRVFPFCMLALAAAALSMTGSKGAILALGASGAFTALIRLGLGWRSLAVIVIGILLGIVVAIPALGRHTGSSVDVRLDYWRGAAEMIRERPLTGFGMEGFQVEYPRTKPFGAEQTIVAHNEVIQAACDLGIPAACILLMWWVWGLWRLRPAEARGIDLDEGPTWSMTIAALVMLAAVMIGLGVLINSIEDLPGMSNGRIILAMAVVIVVAGTVLRACRRLGVLPGWSCFAAVLASLLHSGIDFDDHSPQIVGILALVAVLGGIIAQTGVTPVACSITGPVHTPERPGSDLSGAQRNPSRPGALFLAGVALLVLLATLAGLILSSDRSVIVRRGDLVERTLRRYIALNRPDVRRSSPSAREVEFAHEDLANALATEGMLDLDTALSHTAPVLQALAVRSARDIISCAERWPPDPLLAGTAMVIIDDAETLDPDGVDAFTILVDHCAHRWHGQVMFTKAMADQCWRMGAWAESHHQAAASVTAWRRQAEAWYEQSIRLYPGHLPFHRDLIIVAQTLGDEATVRREQAEMKQIRTGITGKRPSAGAASAPLPLAAPRH